MAPPKTSWSLVLEDFRGRLQIRWIAGKHNVLADALSRDPAFKLSTNEMVAKASHVVIPPDAFEDTHTMALNVLSSVALQGFENDDTASSSSDAELSSVITNDIIEFVDNHDDSDTETNESDIADPNYNVLYYAYATTILLPAILGIEEPWS
ncbi:hypothetical protein SeLEV6574_g02525 [Synchytrium endobioticum]|uniref:Reverse transcriptase RNase H-like domain-containing protein n=1 Tax=Synchytrium endobioticum TaxID=286115 RepID=A0A507D8K4_9FUNG|nr:hypothetical protein SeLEV6574_g02525 [Synchytrium endobioticum]